jgi:glutamate-1-semialdehyde aminotransferase
VPSTASDLVDTFRYNDLDSLAAVFDRYPDQVACVLMMPFEVEPPAAGFLAAAAELTRSHGALFVLDEMRSGFRMSLGGAQQFYGVDADLATFSKAMANGYPISAVVGQDRFMRAIGEVHIGSTFHVNGAEMAAAVATISQLRDGVALDRVARLGQRLLDGLARQVTESGLPATVLGVPQMPYLRFTGPDEPERQRRQDAFYTETTRRGVLLHPNHHWYISAAMTEQDIDAALVATSHGFAAAAEV